MAIMYDDLATWWPLLSPVADYAEEAAFFLELIDGAGVPEVASMIEFGAGGGNNAWYLKKRFRDVLLTDLSPAMLRISEDLNPDCAHRHGDMRTLDAGREFDVVFIHDAINYMTTRTDLQQVFDNAFRHCKPGGLVLLVPDVTTETWTADSDHGGSDAHGRGLRYLEWRYDPDPEDTEVVVEYVFACRIDGEPLRVEHETHRCGVFPHETWLAGLKAAGFRTWSVIDGFEREIFLGRRP